MKNSEEEEREREMELKLSFLKEKEEYCRMSCIMWIIVDVFRKNSEKEEKESIDH